MPRGPVLACEDAAIEAGFVHLQVGSLSSPSRLEAEFTLINASPELSTRKVKHLMLQESITFFEKFMDQAVQKAPNEATKQDLTARKKMAVANVEHLYGGRTRVQRLITEVKETEAQTLWTSPEEELRQRKMTETFTEAMYNAVASIEKDETKAASLHATLCKLVAKERAEDLKSQAGERSELLLEKATFIINQEKVKTQISVTPIIKDILTSLDKRFVPKPVNLYQESLVIETKDRAINHCLLRSGSFDMPDLTQDTAILAQEMIDMQKGDTEWIQASLRALNQNEKQAIANMDAAFIKGNSHQKAMILAFCEAVRNLPLYPHLHQKWIEWKKSYLASFQNDLIIKKNQIALEPLFALVSESANNLQRIGLSLPPIVASVYRKDEDFNKPSLFMISLQTPVNVIGGEGRRNALVKRLEDTKLLGKACKVLTDPDVSELYPVHREMAAFNQVGDKLQKHQNFGRALYINHPTNLFGKEVGGKKLYEYFVQEEGEVAMLQEIFAANQEAIKELYALSGKAILLCIAERERLVKNERVPLNDPAIKDLEKHVRAIVALREQLFEETSGTIKLKPDVEGSSYEVIGRITLLAQLLNFSVNGHCRSGNNRTAAWLSKSHQLATDYVTSSDGKLPSMEKTREQEDATGIYQWGFHSTSSVLQQTNKGTQGSKVRTKELAHFSSSKSFSNAILNGAFALAGRFSNEEYQKAHESLYGNTNQGEPSSPLGKALTISKGLFSRLRGNK